MIFLPRFTWLPPSQSSLKQAPRLSWVLLLVVTRKSLSHVECLSQALAFDDHLSLFVSHFTRVALRNPHVVSTIPPYKSSSSPEPRIIFSHALTEPQATKPSRRQQPPRVTSTTGLQHEHLVSLKALSQCNYTRITHSLLIRNLASTSELEGSNHSQAWTQSPPRCPTSPKSQPPLFCLCGIACKLGQVAIVSSRSFSQ